MPKTLPTEDLSFVDRAPLLAREEVVVASPPASVWPALADATAWTGWFHGMTEARYTTPEPYGVGSRRHIRVQGLVADEEVLAYDEDERFAFRVLTSNLPVLAAMVEVITLEPVAEGTRVVYRQAIELERWAALATPLLRWQLRSGLRKGLAGLGRWVADRA